MHTASLTFEATGLGFLFPRARGDPTFERREMLAYDYPAQGVFLTMLLFFLWIMWILILFRTIADIFRSDDLSGVGKVAWLVVILVLPYLGVFSYVIVRGSGMAARDQARAVEAEESFKAYIRESAGASGGGAADELAKLADLRDRGVINDDEFQQQKSKILST